MHSCRRFYPLVAPPYYFMFDLQTVYVDVRCFINCHIIIDDIIIKDHFQSMQTTAKIG